MEHDFFKRYIQEHKDAFEDDALPPNMLGNILGNLKERQAQAARKKRKLTYTWLAVACSLFMVAGAYLFLSQDKRIAAPKNQMAITKHTPIVEQQLPVIAQSDEPIVAKAAVSPAKKRAASLIKPAQHQDIYDGLADSLSVAVRLDAILKASSLKALNNKLKNALCYTFNHDVNDNVRLAALEVLAKHQNDKYVQQQLIAGLDAQKDPVIQFELVKVLGSNANPNQETTDKLIAMANNPYTVDAVKEQVYYALLTQQ